MNRQDMIKMMGAATLGHIVTPTAKDALQMTSEASSPKLFLLVGEHVQAWCSAASLDDADRLFQEKLDPLELSATSLREVKEDEWEAYGVRKIPGDPMAPSTGEAKLLACHRGEYH
jgi:hypothetical protein